MNLYVGLTGLAGAGKDAVAEILMDLANENHLRTVRRNLSDEIRDDLRRSGQEDVQASRSLLIDHGNALRRAFGAGVLAQRVAAWLLSNCAGDKDGPSLVVIPGIRNPNEADVFVSKWGVDFKLLAVEAGPDIRSARMSLRNQYQEDAQMTFQLDEADQAIGIIECMRRADWLVVNDGDLHSLRESVRIPFERLILARVMGGEGA